MEIVERVARAIAEADTGNPADWSVHVRCARAAIEAMREPTEAMVDACVGPYRYEATEQFMTIFRAAVRTYFSNAVDAALNPIVEAKEAVGKEGGE